MLGNGQVIVTNCCSLNIHDLNGLADAVTGRAPDIFLARAVAVVMEGALMKTKGLIIAVVLTLLALGLILPQAALAGNWTFTASLNTARMYHTVTRLANGKVLVAGGTGNDGSYLQSCELYNPATRNWTPAGNLIKGRTFHTAVLLPNGQVLVAGGKGTGGLCIYAELYTPSSGGPGVWSDAGPLNVARVHHSCTLLASGKVLVAGGLAGSGLLMNSCELYDAGGPGPPPAPAPSTRRETIIRPPCCATARSWWKGEGTVRIPV